MSTPFSTTKHEGLMSHTPHWSGDLGYERPLLTPVITAPLSHPHAASSEAYAPGTTYGWTPKLTGQVAAKEGGGERYTLLQKWDGVVLRVSSETFTARLFDSAEILPPHQAVFLNAELSTEERDQIEEGASFVWTIGFRDVGPTRRRDSVIYFRRLPAWDAEEIERGRNLGHQLSEQIGWR